MKIIAVEINGKYVKAEFVRETAKNVYVKLPDGNIVKRHKKKHL